MRVPSTSAITRRHPQQNRAEVRRASFLHAAEQLVGTHGYDAVTMTAIAEHAGASIGTLYDYFPDKPAVALALILQYAAEADAHWAKFLQGPVSHGKASVADGFIDGILTFVRDRPAYLPLFAAPVAPRTRTAREPLRKAMADALRTIESGLSAERAFLCAQVIIELVRGMLGVYRQAAPKDRETVVAEFRKVMRLYLADTLT